MECAESEPCHQPVRRELMNMTMLIDPIQAFSDNYIWCLNDGSRAVIVDPGDAKPVLRYLAAKQLELTAILITHHHPDHTGGIGELIAKNPGIPVIGPANSPCDALTRRVDDGDEVTVIDRLFAVVNVPGHTLDHIAFWHIQDGESWLFCGDTLFAGGCGRVFEGSNEQMYQSLQKLEALPDTTRVYCAHEYTLSNLAFASAVEPSNQELQARLEHDRKRREANQPTVPSTIAIERATNPFLRCHTAAVQQAARRQGATKTDPVATFAAIREWKNNF